MGAEDGGGVRWNVRPKEIPRPARRRSRWWFYWLRDNVKDALKLDASTCERHRRGGSAGGKGRARRSTGSEAESLDT